MSAKGDWRKLVQQAKERGWVEVRQSRHLILMWPPTNRRITISGSADPRAMKNARKQIEHLEQGDLRNHPLPQ
jgi:hypothetical protein